MALQELTSPDAVLVTLAEFDVLGREAFLERYGFGRARSFFLLHDGKRYDSKAIVGVAFGYQYPERGPLSSSDFSGGEITVRAKLEELGFMVQDDTQPGSPRSSTPELVPGRVYSWNEVGAVFGLDRDYLITVSKGGIAPHKGAVLLVTRPPTARSFGYYNDYRDGEDFIFAGRGQDGDQTLEGVHLDVAKNAKSLFLFEPAGRLELRFLGTARCEEWWSEDGKGAKGRKRRILRFRIRMKDTAPQRQLQAEAEVVQASPTIEEATAEPQAGRPPRQPPRRTPRPFDESRPPTAFLSSGERVSPEETLAQQEQAVQDHHALLVALKRQLLAAGWGDIEEIPSAVDLWARAPLTGLRVIFEAKTIDASNEVHQTRAALSQLLEYRHVYGDEADELCLVSNAPISEARERILAAMEITCLTCDGETFRASGALDRPWLAEFASSR